jgi:O-antigen/teichoic acid export membrane protein
LNTPSTPPSGLAPTPVKRGAGRFARNIRWQFVANGAQSLLGGLYLVVLGRFLGASDFGVFSVVSALVAVAGQLMELRLQDVVARDFCRMDGEDRQLDGSEGARLIDLLLLEALARLLPCIGLLLLSPWLSRLSQLPAGATHLLLLAAATFLFAKTGWGVTTGLLRVLGRTDLIALCLSADWGLRLLLTTVVALVWSLDIASALLVAMVVGGLSNALQGMLAWREFSRRVGPVPLRQWRLTAAIQRFASQRRLVVANLGVSVSDLMAKDLDVALISSVLTADKVGVYKMAKSFVQVIWRAIDPFYLAIMPEVQKLWLIGNYSVLIRLLRRTSVRLLTLSVVLVALAFALVSLFGEAALGPLYAGLQWPMLLMCTWIVVCAPLVWAHPLAVAIGHPELAVAGSLFGSIVGLTAFVLLTPSLGLNGAAIAWVLTLVAGFVSTAALATWVAHRLRAEQANRPQT